MSAWDMSGAVTGGILAVICLGLCMWPILDATEMNDTAMSGWLTVLFTGLCAIGWCAFCVGRLLGMSL
jgi:hypothetical protein